MRAGQARGWKPIYRRPTAAPSAAFPPRRAASSASAPRLSEELRAIVETELEPGQLMSIEAYAGAGKSTALLEYAKRHPDLRTLYVVFNKSVQEDQEERYEALGLKHVKVMTLDGYAFSATMDWHEGNVVEDYNLDVDLVRGETCALRLQGIRNTLDTFLASADVEMTVKHCAGVQGMNFYEALNIADFVYQQRPIDQPPTFSMVTKYFQITHASTRRHGYDLVMIDEAHDCTPAQLAALMAMPSTRRIIVYDRHQTINEWRRSVAAEDLANLTTTYVRPLTMSWRFGDDVADAARRSIRFLDPACESEVAIRGSPSKKSVVRTYDDLSLAVASLAEAETRLVVLARNNATLISTAYKLVRRYPELASEVRFQSGGPFAHLGACNCTKMVAALCTCRVWKACLDARRGEVPDVC